MVEFLHWRIYSSCVYFIYPSLCSYKNWRVSLFISLLRSQYSGAELALANWNPRCCWYQSCVRGRRCSCVDRQPCRHTWFIAASFQWLQLAVGCSHHLIQPVLNATCVSVYRCIGARDRPAQPTVFLWCGLLQPKPAWVRGSRLPFPPPVPLGALYRSLPRPTAALGQGMADTQCSHVSAATTGHYSIGGGHKFASVRLLPTSPSGWVLGCTGDLCLETSQLFLSSSDSTVTVRCHPYVLISERFRIASCVIWHFLHLSRSAILLPVQILVLCLFMTTLGVTNYWLFLGSGDKSFFLSHDFLWLTLAVKLLC